VNEADLAMDTESICNTIEAIRNLRAVVSRSPNIDQDNVEIRGFRLNTAKLMAQLMLDLPRALSQDARPQGHQRP
jgi:hypothetical protein